MHLDEDMTPMDMSMKVNDKVGSFLCFHNDINKNLLLPNVVGFSILSNNDDDDVNFGKTLSMASRTNHHHHHEYHIHHL